MILGNINPIYKTINTPHLGDVHIRRLSVKEAVAIEDTARTDPAQALILAVAYGVGDKDGKRIVTDDKLNELDVYPLDYLKPIVDCVQDYLEQTTRKKVDEAKNG